MEQQIVLQYLAVCHPGLQGGRQIRMAVQVSESRQYVVSMGVGYQETCKLLTTSANLYQQTIGWQ